MTINRMVIRFKDKSLMKGRSSDFSLDKTSFHLKLLSGEVVIVDMERLKAVFHVKSLSGNKNYKCSYKDPILWGGNKVRVEFLDGEVMVGYTPYHISGNNAVLITPADLRCNNKQIFVITSATREITFL